MIDGLVPDLRFAWRGLVRAKAFSVAAVLTLAIGIIGAALGLAGALATSRVVRGLLFEASPLDPATLGGAALLHVLTSALACDLPMRRATRTDPVVMLRSE